MRDDVDQRIERYFAEAVESMREYRPQSRDEAPRRRGVGLVIARVAVAAAVAVVLALPLTDWGASREWTPSFARVTREVELASALRQGIEIAGRWADAGLNGGRE